MVFLHPGSGKKVSFCTKKVKESQGIIFLEMRMSPASLLSALVACHSAL